jgi:hypothetical protein
MFINSKPPLIELKNLDEFLPLHTLSGTSCYSRFEQLEGMIKESLETGLLYVEKYKAKRPLQQNIWKLRNEKRKLLCAV